MAAQGARVQRLLWASTSPKNSDYSDVKYVEARFEQDHKEALMLLEQLPELGISIDDVTQQLEDEGVEKFIKPFGRLMATLKKNYEV